LPALASSLPFSSGRTVVQLERGRLGRYGADPTEMKDTDTDTNLRVLSFM
jgi:choline dehydrogenase-like flavoprotein